MAVVVKKMKVDWKGIKNLVFIGDVFVFVVNVNDVVDKVLELIMSVGRLWSIIVYLII